MSLATLPFAGNKLTSSNTYTEAGMHLSSCLRGAGFIMSLVQLTMNSLIQHAKINVLVNR